MLLRPTLSKVFEPTVVAIEPKQSMAQFKVSMQNFLGQTWTYNIFNVFWILQNQVKQLS